MEIINGGVCAATGFTAGGIHCGIRKNKTKKDLSLIFSEKRASAAAVYTTNLVEPESEILRIPIWLLDIDDLALLLDATTPSQLPIIEKTLKLVRILTGTGEEVLKRK